MISDSIMTKIRKVVHEERLNATKEHGEFFHSKHEGYGVLVEEFDEMTAEYLILKGAMQDFRHSLKDDRSNIAEKLSPMYMTCTFLIAEAVQVAAMIEKFRFSIDADYGKRG